MITIQFNDKTQQFEATLDGFNNEQPIWKAKSLSKLLLNLSKYYKGQNQ